MNPEQIFNIIEAKVVDEYGQPTSKRKVTPPQWFELYKERFRISRVEDVREEPPHSLHLPGKVKQTWIITARDTLSKLSNRQYLLINLLEGPALAAILAFVIRYNSAPGGKEYIFRFNENFPAFMLMSIIVALFMGLTVSAEEIIRDRKILKRESFLNLSWNSYLMSKLIILFSLSAIQTLSFVLVGNIILEIEWRMLPAFWFMLFSVSCMANVLGLNISSAFNSAVTVYVLIPLLLIPQMILSGLLFNFDKLNEVISTKGKVPVIADFMASRWAYEGLAVYYFKNNSFEEIYYDFDKVVAQADFRSSFLVDELDKRRRFIADNIHQPGDSLKFKMAADLSLIQSTIEKDFYKKGLEHLSFDQPWTLEQYTAEFDKTLQAYFDGYRDFYQEVYNVKVALRERLIADLENQGDYNLNENKNVFFNESLADLVMNVSEKDRIIEYDGELVQQINPIFLDPRPTSAIDYRTHFFSPKKNLLGAQVSTFWFNALVIWIMTVILYVALYFEFLRKLVTSKMPNRINTIKEK